MPMIDVPCRHENLAGAFGIGYRAGKEQPGIYAFCNSFIPSVLASDASVRPRPPAGGRDDDLTLSLPKGPLDMGLIGAFWEARDFSPTRTVRPSDRACLRPAGATPIVTAPKASERS